jgi:CRISPR-associated endonuclease/helicase Cas3
MDNFITEMFDFSRRFGFSENLSQKALVETVSSCHRPGIIVIEDQMGSGKTEAALAAAEIISHEKGCRGLFFGLPTQATANGIFPRLLKWGESQTERTIRSIRLAHGGAEYSKEYRTIKENSVILSEEDNEGGLIVHEWFSGRKKALLADFVVGTVDQLLMADLKQKHVMLRHLGLAGKVVIVDECHAYDAYMNVYLQGTLEWLGAYGIPTILLSATLPADTRMELLQAYMGKKLPRESEKDNTDYPRLTWSDGDEIHHINLPVDPANGKTIATYMCSDEKLPQIIQTLISEGGCAAVIVNTVRRAQEFYHLLKEKCSCMTIILCHSHYTIDDRVRRETLLLEKVGKTSTGKQRDRVVVVGTQVLEQSLDYDVDVMFSDLCPIDLMLQRMGRLHRHKGRERPNTCARPRFYILKAEEEELEPGAEAIYGAFILKRSRICFDKEIRLPEDIGRLVQKVYAVDNNLGIKDEDDLRKQYLEQLRMKKQKASVFQIHRPDRKPSYRSLYTLQGLISGDIPDNENRAKAAVRDGEDAIEVIVLRKDIEDGVCFLPWAYGGEHVYIEGLPSEEEAYHILQQKMRLPAVFSTSYMIDKTLKELEQVFEENFCEWKTSAWLGSEMILLLDDHCEARLNGYIVSYKENVGFEYFRE